MPCIYQYRNSRKSLTTPKGRASARSALGAQQRAGWLDLAGNARPGRPATRWLARSACHCSRRAPSNALAGSIWLPTLAPCGQQRAGWLDERCATARLRDASDFHLAWPRPCRICSRALPATQPANQPASSRQPATQPDCRPASQPCSQPLPASHAARQPASQQQVASRAAGLLACQPATQPAPASPKRASQRELL